MEKSRRGDWTTTRRVVDQPEAGVYTRRSLQLVKRRDGARRL